MAMRVNLFGMNFNSKDSFSLCEAVGVSQGLNYIPQFDLSTASC